MSGKKKASGCLFGLALGDALAAPTEFLKVDEIRRRFPPEGPQEPIGNPARVTDDTQMAIAVGEALIEAGRQGEINPATLEDSLRRAFIQWLNSPDNNRAPGMTCIRACENLSLGLQWREATVKSSKGCGANMRVAPVGLIDLDESTRAAIAQFQSALTHAHPTALAASDLTSAAIAHLAEGNDAARLIEYLSDYALSQREIYHARWLETLWEQVGMIEPKDFISRGWDECLSILKRLELALRAGDRASDPCLATGEGWVAEEAMATALLCFLLFADDPVAALRRAAVTSGDSDSIACLTGAFAGACYGIEAWPQDWTD
ncbi:MAG TPA: ADP-ribosylglycohydrolase family protein, partial [Blastocatellia bacterium]